MSFNRDLAFDVASSREDLRAQLRQLAHEGGLHALDIGNSLRLIQPAAGRNPPWMIARVKLSEVEGGCRIKLSFPPQIGRGVATFGVISAVFMACSTVAAAIIARKPAALLVLGIIGGWLFGMRAAARERTALQRKLAEPLIAALDKTPRAPPRILA